MRKHTFRTLLTAFLLVLALGSMTAVYGVTIAGGKVETNTGKTTTTTTGRTSGTTSGSTSSVRTSGTGTQSSLGTGYVLSGNSGASSTWTGAPAAAATTIRTGTTVQTGYLDDAMPFLIVMGMGVFALLAFSHLQLNQTRYGKSEKYARELKDFRKACSID